MFAKVLPSNFTEGWVLGHAKHSPGGHEEKAFVQKEWSAKGSGHLGILMRLLCKALCNQVFILNVNLWGN